MSRFGRNPVAGITRPTASVTGWPAVVPVTARPSPTSLGMAAKEAAVQSVCPSTTSWRSRLPSWLRAGNRSRSPPPYRREASAARTAQLIRVQLNPLVPADWVKPTCRTRRSQPAHGGQLRCRRPVQRVRGRATHHGPWSQVPIHQFGTRRQSGSSGLSPAGGLEQPVGCGVDIVLPRGRAA